MTAAVVMLGRRAKATLLWTAAPLLALWPVGAQGDETPIVLDRERVVELVRQQSPALRIARARADEARASRVGAGALAPTNPELSASAGPRFFPQGVTTLDFNVTLSWPFDLSGAPRLRADLADERARLADAETIEAERAAIGEGLGAWAEALAADERLALAQQRGALDAEFLRIAKVRRQVGAIGDGDVALATMLEAEGKAQLRLAQSDRAAAYTLLRGRVGLRAGVPVSLPLTAEPDATPPSLGELLGRLDSHPDRMRAAAGVLVAQKDADLQHQVRFPVPKLLLVSERAPELADRAGVDVALPVYQRNQTNMAIASARMQTASTEEAATKTRVEIELRAAYVRFTGALAAYDELRKAVPAIDDTEHLALRGYELGQSTLASVVIARREAASARAVLVDVRSMLLKTRIAVDLASGTVQ